MWGSQEKNLGQKVNEKFFKLDQGKKQNKNVKILLFSALPCFEKLKQYLGGLAIFHTSSVCEGVWKISKPHKFGFSFSKQRMADIFQMQLFSTRPVVHLRMVQLSRTLAPSLKLELKPKA